MDPFSPSYSQSDSPLDRLAKKQSAEESRRMLLETPQANIQVGGMNFGFRPQDTGSQRLRDALSSANASRRQARLEGYSNDMRKLLVGQMAADQGAATLEALRQQGQAAGDARQYGQAVGLEQLRQQGQAAGDARQMQQAVGLEQLQQQGQMGLEQLRQQGLKDATGLELDYRRAQSEIEKGQADRDAALKLIAAGYSPAEANSAIFSGSFSRLTPPQQGVEYGFTPVNTYDAEGNLTGQQLMATDKRTGRAVPAQGGGGGGILADIQAGKIDRNNLSIEQEAQLRSELKALGLLDQRPAGK